MKEQYMKGKKTLIIVIKKEPLVNTFKSNCSPLKTFRRNDFLNVLL